MASRLSRAVTAGIANFENAAAKPVRDFCSLNIRRWLALEAVIPGTHNTIGLAKKYDQHLTNGKLPAQISDSPVDVFCSTDLAYGVNWMFKGGGMRRLSGRISSHPPDWRLSAAVAASSCFPPVFKPLHLALVPDRFQGGKDQSAACDKCIREMTLSDGGLYDNLGLEPIWKTHETVLASGGALFPISGNTGFRWEVGRYVGIPENQALAVRKRWLISNFVTKQIKGTYWGIGATVSEYGLQGGYSEPLVKAYIATIRTDLDSFSEAEACVLENHGYTLADAAIRKHVPVLLPTPVSQLDIPHRLWMEEGRVLEALKDSSRRPLLGHSA